MNKVYKIIWNAARGCYVVASEIAKNHSGTSSTRSRKSLRAFVLLASLLGGGVSYADVVVWDQAYADKVVKQEISGGTQYTIENQQVKGDKALNHFTKFDIASGDIANLELRDVNHQINVVNSKINIDGVVNAIKDNQIGGDVYFFSPEGIAVGATGVINVGRLTLGTTASYGQDLYLSDASLDNLSLKDLAKKSSNDLMSAPITVDGQINAKDSVVIASSGVTTVGKDATIRTGSIFKNLQAGTLSLSDYRAPFLNTQNVAAATTAEMKDGIVLLSRGNMNVSGTLESHGRDISVTAMGKGELLVDHGKIASVGGKIELAASSDVSDMQADPEDPEHGGVITIKEAYVDSSADSQNSGAIEITAARSSMGVAGIAIDGSTIDAGGKNGKASGNVAIHATAQTTIWSWDVGDGAYAKIDMGQKAEGKRNTIIGDNIDVFAQANNTGNLANNPNGAELTDTELEAAFKKGIGFFEDKFKQYRPIAAVTQGTAEAKVNIALTDMKALGTGNANDVIADTEKHGDVSISTNATSKVATTGVGALGLGVVIGISDVKSQVDVDDSTLYAQRDVKTNATADNTVLVDQMELALLQDKAEFNFTYGKLTSDATAHFGKDAIVTTGRNVNVSALSARQFSASAMNGGHISAVLALGVVDTKANASVEGDVYAGGNVSVHGRNTMKATGSGVYQEDTVSAAALQGDSGLKPLITWGKEGATNLFNKLKERFGMDAGEAANLPQGNSFFNKLGINAAAAYLSSANSSNASVTGTIRGVKTVDGVYVGDADAAAKSLAVNAKTISRAHSATTALETQTTGQGGDQTLEDYTAAVSFTYLSEENHSTAYVGDGADVKTTGDVTVNAETQMPWQTSWQGSGIAEIVGNVFSALSKPNVGLPELVDSWAQTAGKADEASGAVSVSLINYDNSAKAYIGKSDDTKVAPTVVAGGDVNVNAKTDTTTVNFAGSIQPLFDYAPMNFLLGTFGQANWTEILNRNAWLEPGATNTYGLGGAVLRVHQTNDTKAYIDGGASVTSAKSVNASAETVARNLAISTAGGKAKSVAFDSTVTMDLFDNDTKAYIGDATVKADDDVNVKASDDSWDINLAGAVGASGAAGIGASIAYNHISRETEAYVSGIVHAADAMAVSAKNDGYITTASLAGAIAYDGTDRPNSNHAGAWGDHVRPPTEQERIDGLIALLPEWEEEVGAGGGNLQDEVNEIVQEVAGADNAMAGNVGEAAAEKNKLTVAANLSINRMTDNAKAHVGNGNTTPIISTKTLDVSALNDSSINAITGVVSANMSAEQGNAIGGSFMWNSISATNEAYVNGADLTLSGEEDEDKALTISAHNKERVLNVAASGSGTGQGIAGAGQISVNKIDDTTKSYAKDSNIHVAKAMTIVATDEGKLDSYTGAVAFSGGGVGTAIGGAIAVNWVSGDTKAYAEDNDIGGVTTTENEKTTKKGSLTVKADSETRISSVAASGAVADQKAGSLSAVGNKISTTAEAHVSNVKNKVGGVYGIDVDTATVSALNHSTATTGVGALGAGSSAVGASIGVMVHEGTAKAYVEGDAEKKNTLKVSQLTIQAENSYNGDAKDSEDDSTSKTVAIGAAGGASTFGGAGSVTVNKIKQTTDAYLGQGNFDISNGTDEKGKSVNGAAAITAKSSAKLFGLAGGLSLSGGSAIGAAVDVQAYDGHTHAGIRDGATLSHAGSTTVTADSSETLTSIGAAGALAGGTVGGAGAAGAHTITTNTKAYVGDDQTGATLTDAGDVSLHAKDDTKLKTGSGAAGGSAGTAGVGLSAAVEVVNKTVESLVGNNSSIDGASLAVLAENKGSSTTAAAALGVAGTAGVAGAASETFVDYTTKAHVGKKARVTIDGAASVKADSSFKQGAGAGGAGVGGTWGLGITNSTVSYKATTESYVDDDATVDSDTMTVEADQKTDVTYATVAGGAGGNIAINGAIGVNVLDTTTKAYTGKNAELTANKKIAITAKDETILDGGNGGVSIGVSAGGGGMTLGVSKVIKDTEAFTGEGALLNTTEDSEDSAISISAKNAEAIRNITIQGAGGTWAGIAGAVNLNYITATTKAYTGSNTDLIQGTIAYDDKGAVKEITKAQGTISVDATHDIGSAITRIDTDAKDPSTLAGMSSYVIGATGSGGASVGATVDSAVVVTKTNAYLGNGNTVKSKGALTVDAKDHMKDISSTSLAASIGTVGLTGSFSVYNFGNDLTDEDKKTLTAKAEEGGKDTSLTAWLDEELKNTNISKGFDSYDSEALSTVKTKLATEYTAAAPTMEGEKGTLSAIGSSATIEAGNVTVKAGDEIAMNQKMGTISGSAAVSAGATVTRVTTDTLTQAKVGDGATVSADQSLAISADSVHHLESHVGGAAISAVVGLQGTVSTWNDKSQVHTTIGANSKLDAGEAVRITSANTRTMNNALVGASAALYGAANGAVIYASIDGDALTTIGDGVTITSAKKDTQGEVTSKDDIVIDASADTTLIAGAVGAAVGAFAGTGTGVSLASDVTAKTSLGNQAALTGKNISITAENTPILKATATSAGLGLAGVGITVAKTDSKDKAQVVIGNKNTLDASETLAIQAAMKKPTATDGDHAFGLNGYASSTAGSGGVVSGAVATAFVETDQVTSVEIGSGNTLKAKTAEITADHQDAENVVLSTLAAGLASGTGGEMGTTVKSDAHVTIGDGSTITTTDETKILASNDTEKAWQDGKTRPNADVIGAALASGVGVVNHTTITQDTKVDLGKVTIQANAADLTDAEKAAGVTLYDKNAIDINAKSKVVSKDDLNLSTGAAVMSSYAKNTNTVTANTGVTVGDGADLKAGDTEKIKETHTETYADPSGKTYSSSYRGGSIAIGSRNDAELDSSTMVDIYGLAGHAGSSNEVTYNNNLTTTFGGSAETAKGDIAIHAGRDTQGATGTVKVTARSDVLNATAVPLSYTYDPTATVNGKADLKITGAADLKSDRDISLKAKTGEVTAQGYGETKSWVNSVKEIFGEGVTIGKTVKNSTANVEVNGKAETGIHRNKTIQMGGYIDEKTGKWVTTVSGNGDISYSFSNSHAGGSDLYEQYEALKKKIEEYSADPAAKAGYEAEMQFLQQKMVEQGLAYVDESGNFVLVKNAGSTPEIESAKTTLDTLKQQQAKAIEGFTEVIEVLDKEKPYLENMLTAYKLAMVAKEDFGEYSDDYRDAVAAYEEAVRSHNEAMNSTYYPSDISQITAEALTTDIAELTYLHDYYSNLKTQWESNTEVDRLDTQIKATEKFFTNGGVEDTTTGGFTLDDKTVEAVDANGNPVDPKDGTTYYYLLHKESYNYLIHDLQLSGITSQLGDIDLEGDNVYGTGSLTAHGDGSVSISNDSPNNLKVGDITIAGSAGTSGAGQGGTIYYNNSAIRGDMTHVKDAIKELNGDKTKDVGFAAIENRDTTDLPAVEVANHFVPKDHLLGNIPVFGPSQTYLTGYIYNPRGSVYGVSEYGDIYNQGTILAGSVKLDVKNGDYIQSYDITKSGTVTNIGGAPLTDTGEKKDSVGEGITANGNIFISARYLNINSKIQSGYSDVSIHIPEDYKLYYTTTDASGSVVKNYVTSKDQLPTDRTVTIHVEGEGLSEEGAKLLTFDFDNDRFLVNDIETGGGHISLVGTILNTTADTGKAKLEARDGYGNIEIRNDSTKDLEIRSLSTGSGAKGVIEITDLDYRTGKITRKTTYTRKDGKIQAVVEEYSDGAATGKSQATTYDGAATYNPDTAGGKGLWYNYQTGQQTSYTATYKFDGSKFDWWGIANRDPTVEEMEQQGEKISDPSQGKTTELNGGAFISNAWQNGTVQTDTDDYKVSTNTSGVDKQVVGFYKEAYRPFWTLWITKKYNYTLVEKKTDLHVTQSSIKADNPIGISFTGNADGGLIDITNTKENTNIRLNGLVQNGEGVTNLTTNRDSESAAIIQESGKSFIYTKDLNLASGGNAGKTDAAIATDAKNLTATSTYGQVAVSVTENVDDAVTLGHISAKTIATISSDGSIRQKEGETITARRIALTAADGIYGKEAADGYTALITHLTDPKETDKTDFYYRTDDAYGLYARANEDIYIRNEQYEKDGKLAGGDMYIDSVISSNGNVTLETEGSFLDANFSDQVNQSATDKLLHWAEEAVLEKEDSTKEKQKDRLSAAVQSKYNEYLSLKAHMDGDTYVLDEDTRAMLVKAGYDEKAIEKYREDQQVRYNSLVNDWKVDTWTEEEVKNYVNTLDSALFGNAELTADQLAADKFLSQQEKANCLVNSAKSAAQLLVTMVPGGIKEGITDTRLTLKATPNVSGTHVSLTAEGKKDGETTISGSGGIGQKLTGQVIDISSEEKIKNLTAADLLMLSSAERGDFDYDEKTGKVTVSYVDSLTADVNANEEGGTITAKAEAGSIYLDSNGALNKGSEFYSSDELRLKASGDLSGITAGVGAGKNLVLESADGKISDVTIEGQGILTARAKDGVSVSKEEGDLIIYTVYASDGDVTIDMKDKGSLYSVSGYDTGTEEGGVDIGTPFTNVEGRNIYIFNAKNVNGITDPVTGHISTSMGLKATGTLENLDSASPTLKEPGQIQIRYTANEEGVTKESDTVDVTLFGDTASEGTHIDGRLTTLTNKGTITAGTFEGSEKLTVYNAHGGTITTGEVEGKTTTPLFIGGANKAEGSAEADGLSLINRGIIIRALFEAKKGSMTITNDGIEKTEEETDAPGIKDAMFQAAEDIHYTGENRAVLEDVTLEAGNNITVHDRDNSSISIKKLHAGNQAEVQVDKGSLTVEEAKTDKENMAFETGGDMTITTADSAKDLTVDSGGKLTAHTLKAAGSAELASKDDLHVENLTANIADIHVSEGHAKVDTAETTEKISIDTVKGNITTGTVTTKDADYHAGGTLTADTLRASGKADLDSAGHLYVKDLEAGSADIDVTSGDAKVDKALAQTTLDIDASGDITTGETETKTGTTTMHAGNTISIGTLKSGEDARLDAKKGDLTAEAITAKQDASLHSGDLMQVETLISKEGNIYGQSGGAMDMDTVTAESEAEGKGQVTLISGAAMDVDRLTAKNGDLTSEGTMTVWDSKTSETLTMDSGKDILVNRSDSKALDMNAAGSIRAEEHDGKSALIHTGSGTMKAGEDILITSREPVEKLAGVDTTQPAGKTSGAGEAGSLYLADATPSTFDVTKKGSAVLSADDALTMTGKKVEADTLQTGAESIIINADNLGVDDLQSSAGELHVVIHGSDGLAQSHYAGLHTTSDKNVTVKDSKIETLNFTGKDHLGIETTELGGDSTMQNDFIRFELKKNPRTDMAEWISYVHLNGYGIDSDHPMSRADDGIPVDGDPTGDTAHSTMNRSLYGRDYLGKDGREKEEEDDGETKSLTFGKVSPKENYETVGK